MAVQGLSAPLQENKTSTLNKINDQCIVHNNSTNSL